MLLPLVDRTEPTHRTNDSWAAATRVNPLDVAVHQNLQAIESLTVTSTPASSRMREIRPHAVMVRCVRVAQRVRCEPPGTPGWPSTFRRTIRKSRGAGASRPKESVDRRPRPSPAVRDLRHIARLGSARRKVAERPAPPPRGTRWWSPPRGQSMPATQDDRSRSLNAAPPVALTVISDDRHSLRRALRASQLHTRPRRTAGYGRAAAGSELNFARSRHASRDASRSSSTGTSMTLESVYHVVSGAQVGPRAASVRAREGRRLCDAASDLNSPRSRARVSGRHAAASSTRHCLDASGADRAHVRGLRDIGRLGMTSGWLPGRSRLA